MKKKRIANAASRDHTYVKGSTLCAPLLARWHRQQTADGRQQTADGKTADGRQQRRRYWIGREQVYVCVRV
jgi:hypothetical protein